MKIKHIELKNFKRFTDLTVTALPETSKLVLVIGSNGSGKSSLFDAFHWLSKKGDYKNEYEDYYQKNEAFKTEIEIDLEDGTTITKHGKNYIAGHNQGDRFIGRSSNRIVPRITNQADPSKIADDSDRSQNFIENDSRFITDVFMYIQQINIALREPVFSGKQADTLQIFRDFIEPLNNSLIKIFGGDENTTIQIAEYRDASPNTNANLVFKKGISKINYELLSHGEKQVVTLLLNFIVRQEYYKDKIIFIDEMDCHLNTVLQANLLEEIVGRWIPDSSQLWTASHSLGFIDYARQSSTASIIDFDLFNFDQKIVLRPLPKEDLDVYEIAIPKHIITSILKGYKLVVVENTNAIHFNSTLGQEGFLFLPANNNREVFLTVKQDKDKLGLRDRDYLKDEEILAIQEKLPNLKILGLSTFENYIYHPDNLAELNLNGFDKEVYIREIIEQKNEKKDDILVELGTSRSHYIEFKDCIKNDQNLKPVSKALSSDQLLDFYRYFNMKKYFDKTSISKYNLSINDLTKTHWFKNAILETLGSDTY
jgi:AAA15 family ATPase/GTPase